MKPDVIGEFLKWIDADGDVEAAAQLLRDGGYSKTQSIKAFADTGRFDLAEAKLIVHESAVWRDVRARDTDLHGALESENKKSQPHSRE